MAPLSATPKVVKRQWRYFLLPLCFCFDSGATYAAKVETPAEIFSVKSVGRETGSQAIQPAQSFFTKGIDEGDRLQIQDAIGMQVDVERYTEQLICPRTGQLAFQHKDCRFVVGIWRGDPQHALCIYAFSAPFCLFMLLLIIKEIASL
jgi:hypothetical protein